MCISLYFSKDTHCLSKWEMSFVNLKLCQTTHKSLVENAYMARTKPQSRFTHLHFENDIGISVTWINVIWKLIWIGSQRTIKVASFDLKLIDGEKLAGKLAKILITFSQLMRYIAWKYFNFDIFLVWKMKDTDTQTFPVKS